MSTSSQVAEEGEGVDVPDVVGKEEEEEEGIGLRTPPLPESALNEVPSDAPLKAENGSSLAESSTSSTALHSELPPPLSDIPSPAGGERSVHFTLTPEEWPRWLSARLRSAFSWECREFVEGRTSTRVKVEKGEQQQQQQGSTTTTIKRRRSRPSSTTNALVWRQKWVCVHARQGSEEQQQQQLACPARFEAVLGSNSKVGGNRSDAEDTESTVHVIWSFDHTNHPAEESVSLHLAIEEGKAIARAEASACTEENLADLSDDMIHHLTMAGARVDRKRQRRSVDEDGEDEISEGDAFQRTRLPAPLRDYIRAAIRRGETFDSFQKDLAGGGLKVIGYLGWEARFSRSDWGNASSAVRSKRKAKGIDVALKEPDAGMLEKMRPKEEWPPQVPPPIQLLQRSISLVRAISTGQKLDKEGLGKGPKREDKRPSRLQNLTKLCDELDGCNELFRAVVERYEEAPPGDARFAKYRAAEAKASETLGHLVDMVVAFREKLKDALLEKQRTDEEETSAASCDASSEVAK